MEQENNKHEGQEGESKRPLTISELAKRHLADPDHTTTDEEMKNATIELTESVQVDPGNLTEVDNTTVIPPFDFEKDPGEKTREEVKDDEKEKQHKDSPPNPYDVLG